MKAQRQPAPEPTPGPVIDDVDVQPQPVIADAPETGAVESAVRAWAQAWARQDLEAYFGHYLPQYSPKKGVTHSQWVQRRQRIMAAPSWIVIELGHIAITESDPNGMSAEFVLDYSASNYADTTLKSLVLEFKEGRWLIATERNDRQID